MFKRASKSQSKLRAALFGPSGAGKTFSALRIATGLGGTIAVIDTERGSASKYSDRFEFDVCELADKTIVGYRKAIIEAGQAGYAVLVIDSLSHAWQELLEEIDALTKAKYRGNSWSAWSEGTPKQRQLVDAILGFPGHVLATMRSKTEWTTGEGKNGKTAPVRVGLAPEQGKGIEYEFDLLLEINPDHIAQVIKDRTGKFQDATVKMPGEEFGRELAAWLSDAPPAPTTPRPADASPHRDPPREGPPEPSESWSSFVSKIVTRANDDWRAEMAMEGVEKEKRVDLANQFQLVNHVCSRALAAGRLEEAEVDIDGKPGKRDKAKAAKAISKLYAAYPKSTRVTVEAYLKEKRAELRASLGMPDPDAEDTLSQDTAEDASQEEPEPVTTAGREPGSDDEL